MRRVVLALLFALLLCSGAVSVALAGTVWCVVDPIVVIDGRVVRIQTYFDASQLATLIGPVRYTIAVPSDARRVQVMPAPAGSIAEEVTVVRSLAPSAGKRRVIQVTVLVSASTSFATRTVTTGGTESPLTIYGVSNAPTTYSVFLER
jgi:hypothetical protein